MTTLVGIGNKYTNLDDAIKNGVRNILITSNMHVKNSILLGYGKYHISISNSCLLYLDIVDTSFIGKEYASLLIEGGSIELSSKILCTDNINIAMHNVSISSNGTMIKDISIKDSIISGNIYTHNCIMDNVTIEGEITCNGIIMSNSRLREDIHILDGKNIIINSYIKNITTSENGEIHIHNSDIYNWTYVNRTSQTKLILQHNIIRCNTIPSMDNSIITYNTFMSDINILYVYNSNIGYNILSNGIMNVEFLRNSIVEHNNMSSLNMTHESSDSIVRHNICDKDINILSSKYCKISHNICSNMSLTTLDGCKVKYNRCKNIVVKYLLQTSVSCHTEVSMKISMSIDSKIQYNTCCDVDIESMSRSYYIGNYIDLTDDVKIMKTNMSTISENKSFQGDMGHIHIGIGSDNIIQDNCNISII